MQCLTEKKSHTLTDTHTTNPIYYSIILKEKQTSIADILFGKSELQKDFTVLSHLITTIFDKSLTSPNYSIFAVCQTVKKQCNFQQN